MGAVRILVSRRRIGGGLGLGVRRLRRIILGLDGYIGWRLHIALLRDLECAETFRVLEYAVAEGPAQPVRFPGQQQYHYRPVLVLYYQDQAFLEYLRRMDISGTSCFSLNILYCLDEIIMNVLQALLSSPQVVLSRIEALLLASLRWSNLQNFKHFSPSRPNNYLLSCRYFILGWTRAGRCFLLGVCCCVDSYYERFFMCFYWLQGSFDLGEKNICFRSLLSGQSVSSFLCLLCKDRYCRLVNIFSSLDSPCSSSLPSSINFSFNCTSIRSLDSILSSLSVDTSRGRSLSSVEILRPTFLVIAQLFLLINFLWFTPWLVPLKLSYQACWRQKVNRPISLS